MTARVTGRGAPRAARVALALACAIVAGGCLVTGGVFVDRNRDGIRQRGEPGVAGAVVALERRTWTTTDDDGLFTLGGAMPGEIVWVRVPDGFRPGPVWTTVQPGLVPSLPLSPLAPDAAATPLTFVVGADTHVTADESDPWYPGPLVLEDALAQATDLPEPPRFLTVVGDLTQSNALAEFDRLRAALATTPVPWVPVPGNHDWYDGGFNYRMTFGPDSYSFDMGDVHVVVWDTNLADEDQIAFFSQDLARVAPSMRVVGLGHESPSDEVSTALAELGVDYLFTGHWHANRRVDRDGLVEWGTQPMIMGGIDQSPAGYRVVSLDGVVPVVEHRERLVRPTVALVSPTPGACADPAGGPLVVAAALGAATASVEARVDCGRPFPLVASGGWQFRGALRPLFPGAHTISLRASSPAGRSIMSTTGVAVCPLATAAPRPGAWPQLGGGPAHHNARGEPLDPPLAVRWSTSLGENVAFGTPVVADGVVVVALHDRGDGAHGGLVALELATGAVRWRHPTGAPVPSAPAIAGGLVVAGLASGTVVALDLATGVERWRYDLGVDLPTSASSLWSAPTIADGVVHVAVQGRVAALDLATGAARWTQTPRVELAWLGTQAAVTVADGQALVALNRDLGLSSWDAATGAPRWANISAATLAVNASPLVVGDTTYVVSARGDLSALDRANGRRRWSVALTPGGFDWGYSVVATPAYADGRLFVATQWHWLLAIDAATGAVRWRLPARGGPLNFAHYRAATTGFIASPVVTGDVVWVGHPDGTLAAHDVRDGAERFHLALGAPIVSAPAPAGDYLVVATYDGTVRALVPAPAAPPVEIAACGPWPEPEAEAGCCAAGRAPRPVDGLLALVVVLGLRRRRRP